MQFPRVRVAVSLGLFWSAPEPTAIETRVLSSQEERFREIVKVGESFRPTPAIKLQVQFRAKALADITHWGSLKITKAEDDLGNNLILDDDFMQTPRGDKPQVARASALSAASPASPAAAATTPAL